MEYIKIGDYRQALVHVTETRWTGMVTLFVKILSDVQIATRASLRRKSLTTQSTILERRFMIDGRTTAS